MTCKHGLLLEGNEFSDATASKVSGKLGSLNGMEEEVVMHRVLSYILHVLAMMESKRSSAKFTAKKGKKKLAPHMYFAFFDRILLISITRRSKLGMNPWVVYLKRGLWEEESHQGCR